MLSLNAVPHPPIQRKKGEKDGNVLKKFKLSSLQSELEYVGACQHFSGWALYMAALGPSQEKESRFFVPS